ncbi:sugar kinase [Endozoicomonas ascidiicola]|uniref:sugar kinase n=1 Tax=Endozoicomonas ascidiicola TaxID=1698521 RepID=UPI000A7338D1|nr:sugar kinase [Endozoicomonas ascidiicola]
MNRCLKEYSISVDYVTAIGTDSLSIEFLDACQSEGLDTSLIAKIPDKQLGLYAIHTDDQGERSFSYWRNDSAAKQLLQSGLTPSQKEELSSTFGLIYYSGISLAILDPHSRRELFDILTKAKANGSTIAFDNNYRRRLWESETVARNVINQFLKVTDIALVTFDDEEELYGDSHPEITIERIRKRGVREIVVKDGSNGCSILHSKGADYVPAIKVRQVVDTTSAGDSFNAAYLASRISGLSSHESARNAHILASTVIQHKGAIIPPELCLTI